MRVALTGATGFLGSATLAALLAGDHEVTALTRRPQPHRDRVRWVEGDLSDAAALATLVDDAEAVLHIAGAVNARDRAAFAEANAAGTGRLLHAARTAHVGRFVLVSSLSAREPQLSDYGWSKREGEAAVERSGMPAIIVRPPAIYGPADRELLEMFRMAARGLVLLPPPGRLSIIHVDDLARLLVALVRKGQPGALYEPDDGTAGGFTHRQFGAALGRAVGRRVLTPSLPRFALMAAARIDRIVRGAGAKLTPDRVRYFCHPDWVCDPARAVPADLWTPAIAAEQGLAATAAAYRAKGLL